ncbi:MAG: FtsX-like permease family protein [Gemmataceae bacterium]
MMSLFRLTALRPLTRRWERSFLVVASIALGVATLVSSRILNERVESATNATTTPLKATADLFVTNGELGVYRSIADELRAAEIPGVKDVRPLLYERVVLPELGDRSAVLVGADLSEGPKQADELLKVDVTLTDNFAAVGFGLGRGVIVSKPVYDAARAREPGEDSLKVTVRVGNRVKAFPVAGYFTFRSGSPAIALGNNILGLELAAASRFLKGDGPTKVNRIDIAYLPGANADAIRQRTESIVKDRAKVETPDSQGRGTQDIVSGMKIGFTLCSLGAMVVGMFLVYNAMAVTVAEQRPEIGIMRSVGATRGQIIRSVTGAAAVLGLIGAGTGVPLGIALANYALIQFRELLESIFLNPDATTGWPDLETVLLAVLTGVSTAVFAALVPAIQAVKDDPAHAARRKGGRVSFFMRMVHALICVLLVGTGITFIFLRSYLPHRMGSIGGMMMALVGLLLAAPLVVGGFLGLVNPLLRRVLPIEGRIAADNMNRTPGRTGLVIGALAAGVTVMVQTAGVAYSNEKPFTGWIDQILRADMYVFGGSIATGTSSGAPMEPSIVTELGQQPGIALTTAIRFSRPEYNGTIIYLIAVDAVSFSDMLQSRGFGPPDILKYKSIQGNKICISENFAVRHGIRPGQTVTVTGAKGPVTLEVLDTVIDYSWSRGTIIMDRTAFGEMFGDTRIDLVHVFLDPKNEELGRAEAKKYCDHLGITLVERDVANDLLIGLVGRLYSLAYLQQVVVGLVASLGVVTALLISVIQRKRELGLLLAVGATPGQIIRSVLWEAVLMGLFGTGLGLLVGYPLEWYVLRVIIYEETGFTFAVLMPWKSVTTIAIGAVAMATMAGMLPAWNAVRTKVVDAISYE